jgi:hypothetical protein
MLWSERSVRDHRRQTDCAIHNAYVELAADSPVSEKFHELLDCARKRAVRLFEAPVLVVNGKRRHLGIDALVNLSRFQRSHIRPAMEWSGTSSSWRPAVSSLAHHLVCEYQIPMFLASSWYATDPAADKKRGWFVAHSRGVSFRSLNLPIVMTRKMERIFLASQDHLSIEQAMRTAELLALGAPQTIVKEILTTPLAADLRNGEFWRTVWIFLVANADEFDPTQIGPMIDYIQAVRHDRIPVETPGGTIELDPPVPEFSMKGRTVQSLLRLIQAWHKSLGMQNAALSWTRSPFQPLLIVEPSRDRPESPRRWQMLELTNSAQLRMEGSALHHCVASYADRCYRGASSIWSLRLWQGEMVRHVLTVEIDLKRRSVVQARGKANRAASGRSLQLLQDWSAREDLRIAI